MPRWIRLSSIVLGAAALESAVLHSASSVQSYTPVCSEAEGLSLLQEQARTFLGVLLAPEGGTPIAPVTNDYSMRSSVHDAQIDQLEVPTPIGSTTPTHHSFAVHGYFILGGVVVLALSFFLFRLFLRPSKAQDSSAAHAEDQRKLTLTREGTQVEPWMGVSSTPNAVHTNRFTLITWLPKSLYLQFHRVANIYFVAIAILACTPLWGGQAFTKVSLVCSILLIQAFKDAWEDLKNARDDRHINALMTRRFDFGTGLFVDVHWEDIDVGDLVLIEKGGNSSVPADILVLASAENDGVFYLSTKSLDGETNLKERQAPPSMKHVLAGRDNPKECARQIVDIGLELQLEPPHVSLLEHNSSLRVLGGIPFRPGQEQCIDDTIGVNISSIALRGTELHNTNWVLGTACYVGDETKARLNSVESPSKTSDLAAVLNSCVMCILVCIILVSLLFALCSLASSEKSQTPDFFEVFVKYSIVLYCVLPMTLYVAFEFLHLIMGRTIETDPLMYDKGSGAYAKARNTSVVEELGQVDFLFSDKTGTLTANEMRFSACCIGDEALETFTSEKSEEPGPGAVRARRMLGEGQPGRASEFFESLAVCHTAKVDEHGTYEAESPDEAALVQAASSAGMRFVGREVSNVIPNGLIYTVDGPQGQNEHIVAHVLAFTSDRKRMSVICPASSFRTEKPGIGAVVITKGADNVMKELLVGKMLPSSAQAALDKFSRQGLRTLVVARREMTVDAYKSWKLQWEQSNKAMEGREEAIASAAADAEVDMTYIGVTALEDRLQDRVPETIKLIREAGVRVWVLTGDKVETAVEIAKSCKLFESDMQMVEVVNQSDAANAIVKVRNDLASEPQDVARGLVLDGASVAHILADSGGGARRALYEMAELCSSCICCRLSPLQKRELVELVRCENPDAITLSIGDGANDVPMIQGAHVGVGIRGKEGSASVQASDMAISQFSFLASLLFCHGRKAYRRLATFLCFFIYRSVVVGWSYVVYACSTNFSGQLAFPEYLDVLYSPLTTIAVVVLVAFDCDFKDEEALTHPELYMPGPSRAHMSIRVFSRWMCFATLHGILAWVVPVYLLTTQEERMKQTHSFWQASFTAFTIIILIVHLKLFVVAVKPMRPIGVGIILVELVAYIPIVLGLSSAVGSKVAPELRNVPMEVFSSWPHLLCLTLVPMGALAADVLESFAEQRIALGKNQREQDRP